MAQILPIQFHERRERFYQCRDGNNFCASKQKEKLCNLLNSGRKRRTRTIFSPNQIAELEHNFLQASYLTPERLTDVCSKLGLAKTQVKVWFKNRRRRNKLSMERHLLKDYPSSCSPSPPSAIDPIEGYPNSVGFHDSKIGNGIVPSGSSLEIEACDNLSNLCHPNNDNKGTGLYPTAVWYQANHSNQTAQSECKPLPSVDRIVKPISVTMDCEDNKSYTTSVLPISAWNPQNALDLQTASALYNDESNNIDLKKYSTGTKSAITAGSMRSFYNQNRVSNDMSDNNLLCTMDSIMRTHIHQTTPSQFAYCFS